MNRCKNGTRKNKKTGLCEKYERRKSKTVKLKNNSERKKTKTLKMNKVNYIDMIEGKQYLIYYGNGEKGLGVYDGIYKNIKKTTKLRFKNYSNIYVNDKNEIIRYYGIEQKNNGEQSFIVKGNLYTYGIFNHPENQYYLMEEN
jgi:hypothetical protein